MGALAVPPSVVPNPALRSLTYIGLSHIVHNEWKYPRSAWSRFAPQRRRWRSVLGQYLWRCSAWDVLWAHVGSLLEFQFRLT